MLEYHTSTCVLTLDTCRKKSFLTLQWIRLHLYNSLAPERPRCHFETAIFNLVLLIGIFTSSKDNALRWMPWDLTDDKSTMVQVMACCRQATSHYLSQCWPSFLSPYGVTRPQWVNNSTHLQDILAILNTNTSMVKVCEYETADRLQYIET